MDPESEVICLLELETYPLLVNLAASSLPEDCEREILKMFIHSNTCTMSGIHLTLYPEEVPIHAPIGANSNVKRLCDIRRFFSIALDCTLLLKNDSISEWEFMLLLSGFGSMSDMMAHRHLFRLDTVHSDVSQYLRFAVTCGNLAVAHYFLRHSKTRDWNSEETHREGLLLAAEYGHMELVKTCIENSIYTCIRAKGLIKAAANGHLDVIQYLTTLSLRYPTGEIHDAIRIANRYKHAHIVDYLMTLG